MKKIKIATLSLLIISTTAFIFFSVYDLVKRDTKPPVITCDKEITVSIEAEEKELLKGVTAKDNRSGDVTDSVVVEKISPFTEEGTRVITYAVIDERGNIGRAERTLRYSDYQPPKIGLVNSLRFDVNKTPDIQKSFSATSVIDGDISRKVRYGVDEEQIISGVGIYPIELSVKESTGKVTTLSTVVELYDGKEENIDLELTEYLVYVEKDSEFHPKDYIDEIERNEDLTIDSQVDTSIPGVYHVEYTVENGNSIGKNRLVVVVEE